MRDCMSGRLSSYERHPSTRWRTTWKWLIFPWLTKPLVAWMIGPIRSGPTIWAPMNPCSLRAVFAWRASPMNGWLTNMQKPASPCKRSLQRTSRVVPMSGLQTRWCGPEHGRPTSVRTVGFPFRFRHRLWKRKFQATRGWKSFPVSHGEDPST